MDVFLRDIYWLFLFVHWGLNCFNKAHLVLGSLSSRHYWYCSKVHVDISVLWRWGWVAIIVFFWTVFHFINHYLFGCCLFCWRGDTLLFSRGVLHLLESQALICESGVCDREDLLLLSKLVGYVVHVVVVVAVTTMTTVELGKVSPVLLLLPLCSSVLEPDLHLLLGHLEEPEEHELNKMIKIIVNTCSGGSSPQSWDTSSSQTFARAQRFVAPWTSFSSSSCEAPHQIQAAMDIYYH